MNKEHIFPEWLIHKTNTNNEGIRWLEKRNVPASSVTIPLCVECNKTFGRELEIPVSKIFNQIENGLGLSDFDVELLIRWLWKLDGLVWVAANPHIKYTKIYTLKDRVLRPIDEIRKHLIFAISLIKELHSESKDYPMGIDSEQKYDAVFVSGVFSRIAMMVSLVAFEELIPPFYSVYKLSPKRDSSCNAKLFYPKIGFKDDVEAVWVTVNISNILSKEHDSIVLYKLFLDKKKSNT
ncbi:hypothetical protein MUP95_02865 [bacterium]|nr:hypothetical protein [bacterium]